MAVELKRCITWTTNGRTLKTCETTNPPLIKTPRHPLGRGFLIGGDPTQQPDNPSEAAAPACMPLTMGGEPSALDPWGAELTEADARTAVARQDPVAVACNWDSLASKHAAIGTRLHATLNLLDGSDGFHP